jgi:hypothetical protein
MEESIKKLNNRSLKLILEIALFCVVFSLNCSARILHDNGKVLKEVVQIFRQYKPLIEERSADIIEKRGLSKEQIEHILNSRTPAADIALSQLNDIAQVVFLRPSQTERKDIKPLNKIYFPYTDHKVFKLFSSIGDVGNIYPKRKHYRYILLNGSTVQSMRERLKTLVDLINARKLLITPTTEIVFLTGERALFSEEDSKQLMDPSPLKVDPQWKMPSSFPKTEEQAARWIWSQTLLPCSLRDAKITFVKAKNKSEKDPVTNEVIIKRPNTMDTVQTWIQSGKIEPGTCLSISSQPYVYRQKATTMGAFKKAGLLKKGFSVEGVGLGQNEKNLNQFKENIAVVLDNFAHTIFIETTNQK